MKKNKGKKPAARALARLFAVQGLYLLRMNPDAGQDDIIADLGKLAIGLPDDFPSPSRADQDLLLDILKGTVERSEDIRKSLKAALTKKWRYERLETLLQVILEAGTYELLARPDIPKPVIINEYVDLAHAYYEGEEPGFINGILEEMSKTLREKTDG